MGSHILGYFPPAQTPQSQTLDTQGFRAQELGEIKLGRLSFHTSSARLLPLPVTTPVPPPTVWPSGTA